MKGNYFIRLWGYTRRMYPLPTHLTLAVLVHLGVAAFLVRLGDSWDFILSWPTLLGCWNVFNMFFILRLMDDIKDTETDSALFPDRPIPSGIVKKSDIELTLICAIIVYLSVNLAAGWAFLVAVAVLAYALLMLKWFFIPAILKINLMLTLLTHAPIIGLVLVNAFAIQTAGVGRGWESTQWALVGPYIVMVWCAFEGWEVSRKTLSAAEETAYITYSKTLGRNRAVYLAVGFQAAAFGLGANLYAALSLSHLYLAILSVAFCIALWVHIRFLANPACSSAPLKFHGGLYLALVLVAQIVEFVLLPMW